MNRTVKEMRIRACLILLLLMLACGGAASAQSTSTSTSTSTTSTSFSQVVITQATVDPGVFMNGDIGTITVTLQNNGADEVDIARATLFTEGVILLNPDAYDQLIALGPGNSRTFTFNVQANGAPGLYEPQFYADFEGSGSLASYVPLQIDNTELQVAVANIPNDGFFSTNREDQITLQVSNPRTDNLSSIIITPSGDGVRSLQSSYFVGNLGPGQTAQAVFNVIPSQETNLTFTTTYENGINSHSTDLVVPILIDNGRVNANLVVNDLTLTPKGGGSYEIDGDVTNSGTDTANAVVVTIQSPAIPVDPYPNYAIGTLNVDDFSSFSLTFTGPALTSVPILVQWMDTDGNSYQNVVDADLRTIATGAGSQTRIVTAAGGGPFSFFSGGRGGLSIPFVPIIIIIVIAVVLVVAWRKGYFDRVLKRGKGKQGNQPPRG